MNFNPPKRPQRTSGPAQGQLGTGPNKAERAKEREAILRQMEAGRIPWPGCSQDP